MAKKAGLAGIIVLLGLVVLVILSSLIQSTVFFTYNQKAYTDAYVASIKDILDDFSPDGEQQEVPANSSQDTAVSQDDDAAEALKNQETDSIEKQLDYLARLQELQSNSSANSVSSFFQSVVNAVLLGAGGAIIAYIGKKAKEAADQAKDAKDAVTEVQAEKGKVDSIAKIVEEKKKEIDMHLAYMDGKAKDIKKVADDMNDQYVYAQTQNATFTQSIQTIIDDMKQQLENTRVERVLQDAMFESAINAAIANATIMTLLNPPSEDIWHMQLQWGNECIMRMRGALQEVNAFALENVLPSDEILVLQSTAIQSLRATIKCVRKNQLNLGLDNIRKELFQQAMKNWEQWIDEIS